MAFIAVRTRERIATLTLNRAPVNALNGPVVDQLRGALAAAERDRDIDAVILTGAGKFFSFGFDIPELFPYSKERFTDYAIRFTDLYTYAFMYPKPLVAAVNGHAIAGGCMLALACDYRVMAGGTAKISLNEIGFASSVFAGATEMLRFWVGSANANKILVSGAMYSADDARSLGVVDQVAPADGVLDAARAAAAERGSKHPPAFASIKSLLRESVRAEMTERERDSIERFVDIWYSEPTRAKLRDIKIR